MSDVNPFESPTAQKPAANRQRSLLMRVFCGILWFVPIYFLTNMLIGGVVGGIAGSSETSYETGHAAGAAAAQTFFQSYGIYVLIAQVTLTVVLSAVGFLPGTSKNRRVRVN